MKDNKNEGALHFAVKGSNKEVISFLVALGFNINDVDELDETPLHKVRFTKSQDYFGMTKFLLEIGADLYAKNKYGNNVAHLFGFADSVSSDDFQTWVKRMIDDGYSEIFAAPGQYHRTPLQAAMERDLELNTVKMILKASRVNIDQPDDNGATLLHLALGFGKKLSIIKLLIQLGASIAVKGLASSHVLHFAVIGGNNEAIRYLISQGCDVNEINNDGNTPLHFVVFAKFKNYVELTKKLSDNGADLFAKNNSGNTLAHEISVSKLVSREDFRIWLTYMIENGYSSFFSELGEFNRNLLHSSLQRHDLDKETMKLIIESAKIDINQPDDNGSTVLHLALDFGRTLDTIKNLVSFRADWNRKGKDHCSIMHFAVAGSNKEAILYFKSLGADVNAKDVYGQTPLHKVRFVRTKDYLGMTKFLSENGANLNARDKYGQTLDQFMSACVTTEDYYSWKSGMALREHLSVFQDVD